MKQWNTLGFQLQLRGKKTRGARQVRRSRGDDALGAWGAVVRINCWRKSQTSLSTIWHADPIVECSFQSSGFLFFCFCCFMFSLLMIDGVRIWSVGHMLSYNKITVLRCTVAEFSSCKLLCFHSLPSKTILAPTFRLWHSCCECKVVKGF